MANQWFKFYGSDYLCDPKLLGVDANTRSCWLTLLCYASISENPGTISTKYIDEDVLMVQAGVQMGGEEWNRMKGVLQRFVDRDMILIEEGFIKVINWDKRQESNLTAYERVKRHREKNVINDNAMITLEEKRREERREEKITASLKYLSEIPESDLTELREKYEASFTQIKRKAEELKNYCDAKGKTYKNYRAFLENALNRDFGRRIQASPVPVREVPNLDPEAQRRVEELKQEISTKFRV